jgi:hypothetical protein
MFNLAQTYGLEVCMKTFVRTLIINIYTLFLSNARSLYLDDTTSICLPPLHVLAFLPAALDSSAT